MTVDKYFKCYYCNFSTDIDSEYQKHVENNHPSMPVYPKTLTFCYMEFDQDKEHHKRIPVLECNYVSGFSQKQLETMRDHLENYSDQK